ncbi:LOW QUALITY PROTEIN: YoxJ protein [Geomicrobium sp. JCM 19039]|nr:LOW QUALITY PROTEIN: YoxJ protein [Geomicrobium sp. JCM 19039]
MAENLFMWFIVFWTVFMVVFMFIGGFFMFRKFLKRLPKEDGRSILDWQDHYLERTRHLWTKQQSDLLEELISPVPELFRDVARDKIAGKIGELAIEQKADHITEDLLIRGYILATPKRDHKFLRRKLDEKNMSYEKYEHLLSNKLSRSSVRVCFVMFVHFSSEIETRNWITSVFQIS